MIDFTHCTELPNRYGGSEQKKKLVYNGEIYLVKFPDPIRAKNNPLSYMNNQFSEYIGCKIFECVGIPVQSTLLGIYYEQSGRQKVVVACKDFTTQEKSLHEFSWVANSTTSLERKISTSIEDVYDVIEQNPLITNKQDTREKFWDMFVVDTLIANRDRHMSNWGFIGSDDGLVFSPVYDCGSSLHALLDDETCKYMLSDKTAFKNEAYNVYSAYSYQGKRINCADFFSNPIEPLRDAILRVVPKIDLNEIEDVVNSTPYISNIRKEFLNRSIAMRKELILDKALKRSLKKPLKDLIEKASKDKDAQEKYVSPRQGDLER